MSDVPMYVPPEGSIPTLEVPSLEGVSRAHLVGIGGAGMRGIARILLARSVAVSGSDLKAFPGDDELRSSGANIAIGHAASSLGDVDAVVVSSAIPRSNPELVAARERGIPVYARAQILAGLATGARTFAVAGTHGKTTTTSMLAVVLARAGLDPTYVVGGDLNESGSGAHSGSGDAFVAETDESDGSFLLFRPEVGIVTNVEEDHLDFYSGAPEIQAAFARFASQSSHVVAWGDDPGTRLALEASTAGDVVTFGSGPSNDARVEVPSDPGEPGRLHLPEGGSVELRVAIPGEHNLRNASAALLAAGFAGVPPDAAADALASFTGVRRRFEFRGEGRGATFVDDYAHLPSEIAATLRAARSRASGRVVAVFQPHRYTRTQALWRPLGESLENADLVVVTDVYDAGEQPIPGVSGKLLVDALAEVHPSRRMAFLPRRGDVVRYLEREVRDGDLVLTLGAGDITMVADEVLERVGGDGA
ncbi:MAG: UDP-N-acetylmuramate--L-alanine ligase [Actinomycetota bacterium]